MAGGVALHAKVIGACFLHPTADVRHRATSPMPIDFQLLEFISPSSLSNIRFPRFSTRENINHHGISVLHLIGSPRSHSYGRNPMRVPDPAERRCTADTHLS